MGNSIACSDSGTCCGSGDSKDAGPGGLNNRPVKVQVPGFNVKAALAETDEPNADSYSNSDKAVSSSLIKDPSAQTVKYNDGTTYTGQFQHGLRHGNGRWESPTGDYEGQWQADVQHGTGHQTWTDGRVFDGQFADGRFQGQGKMVWRKEKGLMTYEGQYKEDKKHGQGKFVWIDGRSWDGAWREGKRHGRGIYFNPNAEKRSSVGYWNDDEFVRWETEEEEATQN